MSEPTKWEDLQPGEPYRIEIQDCCVEGTILQAVFIRHIVEDADDPVTDLEFDCAKFTSTNWGCEFWPLRGEP